MSHRTLPPAKRCRYVFVGEGAANIVFKIFVDSDDVNDDFSEFQGRLLRVPKAGTLAYPYTQLQEYWETVVRPLFPDGDLVHQHLVRLGDPEIITRLNSILPEVDGSRRHDFQGGRVANVEYGMLVEDMSKKHPDDIVFEFKPKWLAQSPNAPSSAIRCRNCAREVHKRHKKLSKTKPVKNNPNANEEGEKEEDKKGKEKRKEKPIYACPLDLLSCPTSSQSLSICLQSLLPPSFLRSSPLSSQSRTRLSHWLKTNILLSQLRDLQLTHDPAGPLAAEALHNPSFQLAMTLRDCSCFVRIPADMARPVEARLADLDMKNWEAKLGYWRATEQELIDGGFYEGREVPRVQTFCLLERGAGTAVQGVS